MNTLESLVHCFFQTNPEAAAHALEGMGVEEAGEVIAELPASDLGPVMERLTPHAAGRILAVVGNDHAQALLAAMQPRQAAAVLQHIPHDQREAALAALPQSTARQLRDVLSYPRETAGGIMDPQVSSIPIDVTVEQAIALIRRAPPGTLYYLYITGRDGTLMGVLRMRDLLLAAPHEPIEPLVQRDVASVLAPTDREEVATLMRQRGFAALPVVDNDGRLLGVVKHDEVLDTVQQEAFEDMQKMVGAGGDESTLSPLSTVLKRRLPWLYVNLLTAFLASAVVSVFEDILARVTALAVLLPIVSGQGGNGGAQALAVVIRGLALREILPGAAWGLLIKELLAGILNGVAVALVTAGVVLLWSGSWGIALVIGLAMIVNMAVAGLAGGAIPLLLKHWGRDPAQSSSIFLTTVTDVVGFASFLGFAVAFSPLLV
jgi:magnesium transporter